MSEIGNTVWHSSDPDISGPDVGIEVALSEETRLYAGEVPGCSGWSIAFYRRNDRIVVAVDVRSDEAREMIDMIGLSLRSARASDDAVSDTPNLLPCPRCGCEPIIDFGLTDLSRERPYLTCPGIRSDGESCGWSAHGYEEWNTLSGREIFAVIRYATTRDTALTAFNKLLAAGKIQTEASHA